MSVVNSAMNKSYNKVRFVEGQGQSLKSDQGVVLGRVNVKHRRKEAEVAQKSRLS